VKTNPLAKAALFVALSTVAVVAYLFLLSVFRGKLGAFSSAVPAIAMALLALILNWRFFRYEKQSLAEIGFNQPSLRIRQVAAGFVAGCMLVLVWALALRIVTSGSWKMVPSFDSAAAIGAITFMIFNNAGEELVYRGYLFLLLARSYGRPIAVISTCALFTLLHIQAGVPWPSAVAGVLTSALVYAALFVRWQSLPLVLAFHVATNFMQELLGIRITGLTLFTPMHATISESRTNVVLLIIGLVNTAVAFVIFRSARKLHLRSSASSADTASLAGSPGTD
jgi:membrane protease YdiL (CAAX protease family)